MGVVIAIASAGAAHIKDGMDEIPSIIVLAQDGTALYDPDASEDTDYPEAIPVRLLRGNSAETPMKVLKVSISTVSPERAHKPHFNVSAPSQQSLYHRQEVLRI